MKVLGHPGHGNSKCFIIGSWTSVSWRHFSHPRGFFISVLWYDWSFVLCQAMHTMYFKASLPSQGVVVKIIPHDLGHPSRSSYATSSRRWRLCKQTPADISNICLQLWWFISHRFHNSGINTMLFAIYPTERERMDTQFIHSFMLSIKSSNKKRTLLHYLAASSAL